MAKRTGTSFVYKMVYPIVASIAIIGFFLLISALLFIMRARNGFNFSSPTFPKNTQTCLPLAPTPTLAPGQKAIYTFYIQVTSHEISGKGIGIKQFDTGRVITVDIGTLIIVNFGRVGKFHLSASSPQDIFKNFGSPETIHLPNNALGAFRVFRAGCGTISVTETN